MTLVNESPGTHAILFSLELRPLILAILARRPQMHKCGLRTHCLRSHTRDVVLRLEGAGYLFAGRGIKKGAHHGKAHMLVWDLNSSR